MRWMDVSYYFLTRSKDRIARQYSRCFAVLCLKLKALYLSYKDAIGQGVSLSNQLKIDPVARYSYWQIFRSVGHQEDFIGCSSGEFKSGQKFDIYSRCTNMKIHTRPVALANCQ